MGVGLIRGLWRGMGQGMAGRWLVVGVGEGILVDGLVIRVDWVQQRGRWDGDIFTSPCGNTGYERLRFQALLSSPPSSVNSTAT